MQCKIQFTFSARQVREHDYEAFLDTFSLDQIPDVALKRYEGALRLDVETAPGDLRPPYLIPEIRRHLGEIAKRWPYSAFCCDLKTPFLLDFALCQLGDLQFIEWGESEKVSVSFLVHDFYRFWKCGNAQIRAAGRRARLSHGDVMHREIAFSRYLLQGLRPTTMGSQGN